MLQRQCIHGLSLMPGGGPWASDGCTLLPGAPPTAQQGSALGRDTEQEKLWAEDQGTRVCSGFIIASCVQVSASCSAALGENFLICEMGIKH